MFSALLMAACGTVQQGPRGVGPHHYDVGTQTYWKGALAPDVTCRGDGEPIIPAELMRPPMMAIGDSIYNGVQSGRINWHLAEWSPPVFVALRLDLIKELDADRTGARSFYVPQYPSNPLMGMSGVDFGLSLDPVPSPGAFPTENRRIANNLEILAERYTPPNQRAMVDNLAYSGAQAGDLDGMTAKAFLTAASPLLQQGKGREAFTYANAAFVLNPMKLPCLEGKTALDQVLLRRPRLLLVNVGSNNGVVDFGLHGRSLREPGGCGGDDGLVTRQGARRCRETTFDFFEVYKSDIRALVERLSQAPDIEDVYINGLIRPSRVANLVPASEVPLSDAPGYAESYALALLQRRARIAGSDVREMDTHIDALNGAVRTMLHEENLRLGISKYHFVDIDAAIAAYDVKACGEDPSHPRQGCTSTAQRYVLNHRQGLVCDAEVDNRPVRLRGDANGRWNADFCDGIEAGGLFSIDNLHPSSVGYAIVGNAVREAMKEEGDIPADVLARPRACNGRVAYSCAWMMVLPGYMTAERSFRDIEFLGVSGTTNQQRVDLLGFVSRMMSKD